jgi:S-formylglutathione hydrolase
MLPHWSRVAVGGKLADAFDPPGARPLCVVYLHSLREETPATSAALTAALAAHRLRCLAPRGGWGWWANRPCAEFDPDLTPERYLLDVLIPAAEAKWELPPRAVALVGAEMGGQAAVRLALQNPARFPVAGSTSGAFDLQDWHGRGTPLDDMYASAERCRLDGAVLNIDARDWPRHLWFCCAPTDAACFRGNDRLREKLTAMGVPHTADLESLPAGDYADAMAPALVAFVAAALATESRKLM